MAPGAEHHAALRHERHVPIHAENGFYAYGWKLDVTEALLLKIDCLVIAGTGSGKTIPFKPPLMLALPENVKKTVLIVSPLVSLQSEQASRFTRVKVKAVAVDHEEQKSVRGASISARPSYNCNSIRQRLSQQDVQAIFAGPGRPRDDPGA
ncbi:hypothetical protein B0H11DRAFT_2335205 [Mycena galericulata]|nr:hypothetical protein B0H11DRAFT_2335205 [Mycena galericulata]